MNKIKTRFAVLSMAAAILAAFAYSSFPPIDADGFVVSFADVGQGDSVLLKTESGKVILVDTGEKEMYDEKLAVLLRERKINKIDLLVASHYHSDHMGAMEEVFEDFEVANLIIPDYEPQNNAKKKLLKMAKTEGSKIYELSRGDVLPDVDPSLKISVMHPKEGGFLDDENNSSLVLMAKCFDTTLLLTGDIEEDAERAIIKEYDIETDILKVAHHGSHTSSCREFLDEADPTFAVIQCGRDNSYGHPHRETLATLEDDDVRVYRTDLDGSITFYITERGIGKIITTKN